MSAILGRLGSDETYKVQFVDDLPEDKIILILDSGYCNAYVVNDYKVIDRDNITGKGTYSYHVAPVVRMDRWHGYPQDRWMTVEEIFNKEDWEVLFLDSLGDMKNIKNIDMYN